MDRLICGDVGYGKTEVALRAAFKAAEAGKQTLVLVPTTILAEQHWMTFEERFADLPVKVGHGLALPHAAPSSARRSPRSAAGELDVLVGTHRLLSTDVRPKELGLVIVDEEQRFGVRQKELLRSLKLQVDVMSLSATPIPRTLQMSLSGIRDISVIETAPRGRHEIRTYIGEYRDDLVRVAIEKELAREGQAFYLHNRVETIDQAAEHVRALAPSARVLVAHGQMAERQLEKVMLAFLAGEADVLVTTSIIESGIDIPTANTLDRGARRHARPGPAVPDPRAHRAQRRARLRLPAVSERRPADQRGGGAPDHAERPHRPRRRLQDRHGRPRDPRRRQPARRRAERARRRRRLRDVRADARGGRERAGRRAGGAGGAGARRPAGHRVRAARVHRLRGDQDRRAPAHRAGAHGRRARRRARRARRPLRPAAGAGGEPHHAAGDPHQGGGARRHRRRLSAAAACRSTGSTWTTSAAARVRTSNARATYFKKDRMLAVHREGQEPHCSGGSRLRSMLYSPLVCLTTGRQSLGERIYEEAHRGCGPARPRRAGAAVRRLRRRRREGPRRRHRRGRQRRGHAGAVRPDLGAG